MGQAAGDLVSVGDVAIGRGQVDNPALLFEVGQTTDGGALVHTGLEADVFEGGVADVVRHLAVAPDYAVHGGG